MKKKTTEVSSTITPEAYTKRMRGWRKAVGVGALALVAFLAACGDNDPDGNPALEATDTQIETGNNTESHELSPVEYNQQFLDAYRVSEYINPFGFEWYIRDIISEQGSTAQVVLNRQGYLEHVRSEDVILEIDVGHFSQLGENFAVFANLIQANKDRDDVLDIIQQAGAKDIIINIPFEDYGPEVKPVNVG